MRFEKCALIDGVSRSSRVVEYQTCPPKSPAGSALPHQLVDPDLLAVACAASSCQDDLFRLG
jgi:hypothetical protein